MQLFSPQTVYDLDRATIVADGISETELMRRAGERVWTTILERWPEVSVITVFAGPGNNGGDAYVVAIAAARQGVDVQFLTQGDLANQSPTAAGFRQQWLDSGGTEINWGQQVIEGEIIVDGLLGIGLSRTLDDQWQSLIASLNEASVPVVAIDIPSGLNAATGVAQPLAVKAVVTVTFIARKSGLYLADGPDLCGDIVFDDLGSSQAERNADRAQLVTLDEVRLPETRRRNVHKNQFGHVLVVGGAGSMSGAVALAARAALRTGAGLVTALVADENRGRLAAVPEVMVDGWSSIADHADKADVVVFGPGLADCRAVESCLQVIARLPVPLVADAGALQPDVLSRLKRERLLLTPHPGEAGRLLSISTEAVQNDRVSAVTRLASEWAATCVLKGSGSLIASGSDPVRLNLQGNPGMATAGSGDVLAGMVAALLAQGLGDADAMQTAVTLHARAADLYCLNRDPLGLMASDIIDRIPEVVHRQRQHEATAD